MKVAIDRGPLTSGHAVRGIGVNTRELIQALENEAKKNKKVQIEPIDFSNTDLSKYDIAHHTAFHPYFLTLPSEKRAKKNIVTIHDLIYLIYPSKYPAGLKGKINFIKQKQRLKNVDAVLTISETSKKDIVRFLNFNAEKVFVVPLAPKDTYRQIKNQKFLKKIKTKYALPDKFVLYVVGGVNYNKNIPNLVIACAKAKIPLIIVGKEVANLDDLVNDIRRLSGPRDYLRYLINKSHPEIANIENLKELFKDNSVITPGFVPDKDLVAIYNLATLYCQPSFYEGFGLPVLEAFACGTPVVVSKTNALVEIAGDAALNFDPNDTKEMSEVIKKVLKDDDLARKMVEKGQKRVKNFNWTKTAQETIRLYGDIFAE